MTRLEVLSGRYCRRSSLDLICALAFVIATLASSATSAPGQLVVTYGAKGVQTLSYSGITLENVGTYPADAFNIAHLQCTDLQGNPLSDPGCSWGETNLGEYWNSATSTETYSFAWGTIATQFVQSGSNLNIVVTETNYAGSGLILGGAEIHAIALHFPQDPLNFNGYSQDAITTTGPAVVAADYGAGVVTSVIPDESHPLYGGWSALGSQTYNPIVASAPPGSLASFYPQVTSPVQPGTSFTFTVSLRFTPEGTAANAQDAYTSFAATYPSQMTWTDRRIIGTAYLASSPSGNINEPGGYPTNPRRYFNDPTVDITTPSGLQAFQDRILAQAAGNAANAQAMDAQGVITWDVEGQEYPQSTSYVCSPDQIAIVAPEMESVVTDSTSPYYGKKLDDSYFATMSSGGLKLGVCIRPQVFTLGTGNTASQVYLSTNAAIIANLENKAAYANSRWGVTVFYVDSTVETNGETLDPAIFQQLITDMPRFLFIPEESTPRYYAYSAPFYSFIDQTKLGTPASTYNMYPAAFGANLVNDVSAATLAPYQPQLTLSVENGDILMGHADYWQANDPTLVQIYANAAAANTKTMPVITWPAPAAINYGTALSATQLDATANVPGTFAYFPTAGAVLNPGSNTLNVTFAPNDTTDYKTATASVGLSVTQSTSAAVVSWPTPAAINYGTALSTTQLDATANVPGTFTYSPPAGTVLGAGSNTLNLTFTPTDLTDYKAVTASVGLTVAQATPVITWATPAAVAQGTALSATQLDATANVPGTFAYTPSAGAVLSAGSNTLNVTFTPTDTTDYRTVTTSVSLTVNNTPASGVEILSPVAGATISGSITVIGQLTVNLDAAGSYLMVDGVEAGAQRVTSAPYLYPLNTATLSNGQHVLQLWAHDTGNNVDLSAPVTVTVANGSASNATITWPAPASIPYGTALSGTQLDATANVPGTSVYSPAAGTVLSAGSNTLNVTFTPADTTDYKVTTAAVSLTVAQATPAIMWPAPAAIAQGTALSATQLDATANVPGTFVYLPAAGTVLGAGSNTLNVTFTPNDTTDYKVAAASVGLTVTPAPTVAAITWPAPVPITYGTALSATQLDATANVPGTFTYSPSAGAVLGAGSNTLNVTFTPTDTTDYKAVTASVGLTIAQATPVITWPTPAAVAQGTALSATQLDATANVPGTFGYTPSAGTVLSAGSNTLNVTFTPTDTKDYKSQTASVMLTVNSSAPSGVAIVSPVAGATVSGSITVIGQLTVNLDAAGSYLMVDGVAVGAQRVTGAPYLYPLNTATLSNGQHVLQLWAHDTGNNVDLSAPITITVANGSASNVTITWPTPAAIPYGTALSAVQLDATANVPGTFVYSPSVGTVLGPGSNTLNVTFTPTDTTDYKTATASVGLTVTPAPTAAAITWPAPAAITYGTALSATQLDATANVPGTFAYSPSAGTVLSAGSNTLNVTFTPTDTTAYKAVTASVGLTVAQAAPVITWPMPAAVAQGTALSAAQLDATANVPGTFNYSPLAGTLLNPGSNTLNVTFTPADSTDYRSQIASVSLTVNSSAPSGVAIVSPVAGATVSGSITVTGQITVHLDAAGSYLMVDGVVVGAQRVTSAPYLYPLNTATLSNGQHVLQLWAHDTGNNVDLSAPITITVAN